MLFLIFLVSGGIFAFLANLMKVIEKVYEINFTVWNIFFYVAAGVMALLAIIDIIKSLVQLAGRRKSRRAGANTLPPKRKKRRIKW